MNSFKSIIHNDNEMSNIVKFQHLRNCLGDSDAANVIRQLELSDVNYKTAIELLEQRYDN
jgi:hypothetical protein